MKFYEMMYVVDPAAEDGVDAVKQKIEGIITGREGSVTSYERLGKKRLAYPIAKRQFGVYYLVNFHGDGKIIQALEQFLLVNPIVLRHIVLAFTEKDLKLRVETERILLEEAERMRMGGKPLKGAEDVIEDSSAPITVKPEVIETPVPAETAGTETDEVVDSPADKSEVDAEESDDKSND